jgi:hypothetical protein
MTSRDLSRLDLQMDGITSDDSIANSGESDKTVSTSADSVQETKTAICTLFSGFVQPGELFGSSSNSRGRRASTPTHTSTAATTEAAAVTSRRSSATGAADGTLTALLPSLDRDTSDRAVPAVNANTSLAAGHTRQGSDDGALGSLQCGELEECTGLAANNLELFDRAKALCEHLVELIVADRLNNSL